MRMASKIFCALKVMKNIKNVFFEKFIIKHYNFYNVVNVFHYNNYLITYQQFKYNVSITNGMTEEEWKKL